MTKRQVVFRNLVYLSALAELILTPLDSALADSQTPPDYDQLHKTCTSGCCESSVEQMRSTESLLKKGAEPCPAGYQANMYRCPGSFSWCEPVKAVVQPEAKVKVEQTDPRTTEQE
jgi:hypothetical protein